MHFSATARLAREAMDGLVQYATIWARTEHVGGRCAGSFARAWRSTGYSFCGRSGRPTVGSGGFSFSTACASWNMPRSPNGGVPDRDSKITQPKAYRSDDGVPLAPRM